MIAGGPEPAQGGRLNIISIHGGTTPGEMQLNWGRALRARYKKDVISCFGDFLKICYTPDVCRSRALPVGEGFAGLVEEECQEQGVELDSVDSPGSGIAGSSITPSSSTTTTNAPITTVPASNSTRTLNASVPRPAGPRQPPSQAPRAVLQSRNPNVSSDHRPLVSPNGQSTGHSASAPQRTPFPFGPGRSSAPYQRIAPTRTNASVESNSRPAHPSALPPSRSSILTPSRRLNTTPPVEVVSTAHGPPSPQAGSPSLHQFGVSTLLIAHSPTPPRRRIPIPPSPPSFRPEDSRNDTAHDAVFGWSGFDGELGSSAMVTCPETSSTPSLAERAEPCESSHSPLTSNGVDSELERRTANAVKQRKKGRRKKSENSPPLEPMRRSSRVVGEKRKEPEFVASKPPEAKKKKKSSGNKYGNWIESDSDGEGGWHDQDGNPCDPPTPFRKK